MVHSIQYTHTTMDPFLWGVCEISEIPKGWLREPIWVVISERSWVKIKNLWGVGVKMI